MRVPFCPFRIFLCHASDDHDAAALLSASLESQGHEVFLDDEDLPPGDTYVDRIGKALRRSHLFMFLVTPRSVAPKRYTLSELELAKQKWKRSKGRVLPVMLEETPIDDVPPYLRALTLLIPRGNLEAEVSQAVATLANRRCRRIYAGLAAALAVVIGGGLWWALGASEPGPDEEVAAEHELACRPNLTLGPADVAGLAATVNGVVLPSEGCPEIVAIEWSWGDGTIVNSWFPASHRYSEPGTFQIGAIARDARQNVARQTMQITVRRPPAPAPVAAAAVETPPATPTCYEHEILEDGAAIFAEFGLSVSINEVEETHVRHLDVRVSETGVVVQSFGRFDEAGVTPPFEAGGRSYRLHLEDSTDHRSPFRKDRARVKLCTATGAA